MSLYNIQYKLDAVTASCQYCVVFTGYQYTTTSHFQVRRNCVEVCQRRRSDICTRALCPHGGWPWSPATAVRVNSLHSTASSSDLYTGQRSFAYSGPAVWNSLPPTLRENMLLATFKTKLKTYLLRRSQWLSKTTRHCCGVFAISAPRYTCKWLYLLTYFWGVGSRVNKPARVE